MVSVDQWQTIPVNELRPMKAPALFGKEEIETILSSKSKKTWMHLRLKDVKMLHIFRVPLAA